MLTTLIIVYIYIVGFIITSLIINKTNVCSNYDYELRGAILVLWPLTWIVYLFYTICNKTFKCVGKLSEGIGKLFS